MVINNWPPGERIAYVEGTRGWCEDRLQNVLCDVVSGVPQPEIANSAFARWLLDHARRAGYAITTHGMQAMLLFVATFALTDGLDETATARVAEALDVTPQEVTDAYLHKMRQRVQRELLADPDLVQLDRQLDTDDYSN
ncbi:hypothetical protein [Streptomyces acidicola]|uniref:hypothetical protein n=1 Tax=Streptomyces acidicola TaxID=2596892 RepID=UPI00341448DA